MAAARADGGDTAELEGQMGDQTVGLQARMMSQAMRRLTAAISKYLALKGKAEYRAFVVLPARDRVRFRIAGRGGVKVADAVGRPGGGARRHQRPLGVVDDQVGAAARGVDEAAAVGVAARSAVGFLRCWRRIH